MLISPYKHEPDDVLIVRTAWLYYIGGLNQEETAVRLGVHRSRVNRLLSEARERGLVSITIQHDAARLLELEHSIERHYGLEFCLCTPPIGFDLKEGIGSDAKRCCSSCGGECCCQFSKGMS